MSSSATTRSLLEVTLGFLGALLIVPLAFKLIGGLAKGVFKGVFKFGVTRRLLADVAFAGIAALLTRTDVLDALFGRKGEKDALLKQDGR